MLSWYFFSACQHSSPGRYTIEARRDSPEEAQWEDTHCYFHEGPELDEELGKDTSQRKSAIEAEEDQSCEELIEEQDGRWSGSPEFCFKDPEPYKSTLDDFFLFKFF